MADLYNRLGITRDASPAQVKAAYRRLAKELHPDRNPGDQIVGERFKEVSAAYHILADETLRARYDRGEIDENGQQRVVRPGPGPGAAGGQGGARRGRGFFDFEPDESGDIFADLFGGFRRPGARQAPPTRGGDKKYALKVDFLDAARGAKKRLRLADGRQIDVSIPAGITEGQQIRLKGQGEQGAGGAGDALIEVSIREHPLFRRDGNDLRIEVPVTLPEAVLGARIKVPTTTGQVTLTVPEGSNSGTTLRLKGKGIANAKTGQTGDQYVTLKIVLPEKPDPELKKWVSRWAAGKGYSVRDDIDKL
ncbi:DnaJ C-terminal domain-containing protein [Oceanibacterium hippocampi]|uniref:Curved DNA-binding protein n=1 Tax=Oceanibacterium hippocampi TaxID=745714 RepID=A0A1Y5SA79_9PROT|nr:J domain-containing protein [Oceanibacterium hippocampi]SLN36123.1 Curved DNA-binding protein [Oceanibacterium hippocampi]